MARATRKTAKTKAIKRPVKPIRKSTPRSGAASTRQEKINAEITAKIKAEVATKKQAQTDTRDGLIAEMRVLLDQADTIMLKLDTVRWTYPAAYPGGAALGKLRGAGSMLYARMAKLLDADDPLPEEVFHEALATAPGTVPTPAFPGMFVEWVGFIPVLCNWGGFISKNPEIRAVNPDLQWLTESGYQSVTLLDVPGNLSVRSWFRNQLQDRLRNKAFKLHALSEWGREDAKERLEWEWLRKALAIGPVDAIALPISHAAMQRSLFAS